jgi:hypothetical protein
MHSPETVPQNTGLGSRVQHSGSITRMYHSCVVRHIDGVQRVGHDLADVVRHMRHGSDTPLRIQLYPKRRRALVELTNLVRSAKKKG